MIDLSSIKAIDAHNHGLPLSILRCNDPAGMIDRCTITGMCIPSSNLAGAVAADFVSGLSQTTPFALALIRELAGFLGCDPSLEAVQRSRNERLVADGAGYLRRA